MEKRAIELLVAYLKERIEETADTADRIMLTSGRSAANYHVGAEEAYRDILIRLKSLSEG